MSTESQDIPKFVEGLTDAEVTAKAKELGIRVIARKKDDIRVEILKVLLDKPAEKTPSDSSTEDKTPAAASTEEGEGNDEQEEDHSEVSEVPVFKFAEYVPEEFDYDGFIAKILEGNLPTRPEDGYYFRDADGWWDITIFPDGSADYRVFAVSTHNRVPGTKYGDDQVIHIEHVGKLMLILMHTCEVAGDKLEDLARDLEDAESRRTASFRKRDADAEKVPTEFSEDERMEMLITRKLAEHGLHVMDASREDRLIYLGQATGVPWPMRNRGTEDSTYQPSIEDLTPEERSKYIRLVKHGLRASLAAKPKKEAPVE